MPKIFLLLGFALISLAAHAGFDGKMLGNMADEYKQRSDNSLTGSPSASGMFVGYVTGIASVLNFQGSICITEGTSNGTVVDTVYKYIYSNPELRNVGEGSLVVIMALTQSFKCKL